ncbi:MAG: hypothetical protein WC766_03625 [Patescibacteria group bacterium]|jgi:hypothetical protein
MKLLAYNGEQDLASLPELSEAIGSKNPEVVADALVAWIVSLGSELRTHGGEEQVLRVILDTAHAITPRGKGLSKSTPKYLDDSLKTLRTGNGGLGAPFVAALRRSIMEFMTAAMYF